MKTPIAVLLAVAVLAGAIFAIRGLTSGSRELTADESLIRDLAREVFDKRIISEAVTNRGGEMFLAVGLRDAKYVSLQVNLSSLARKHREDGLSQAAIKTSLKSMLDGA